MPLYVNPSLAAKTEDPPLYWTSFVLPAADALPPQVVWVFEMSPALSKVAHPAVPPEPDTVRRVVEALPLMTKLPKSVEVLIVLIVELPI